MLPFIRDGDVVTVVAQAPVAMNVGAVVLYRGPGNRCLLHRVIGRKRGADGLIFQTSGDAAMGPPETVTADQMLGCVVEAVRDGRLLPVRNPLWQWSALGWIRVIHPLMYGALCTLGWVRRLFRRLVPHPD
jgi:hypothetical protein